MSDLLDWAASDGKSRVVKNPQARMKYWNDKVNNFLITDIKCEECGDNLSFLGVLTVGVKKYQCRSCYKIYNLHESK